MSSRRALASLASLLLAATACGDDAVSTGASTSASTSTATATATADATSDATSNTSSGDSSSAGSTTAGASSSSSASGTTSDATTDGATDGATDATTGEVEDASYAAIFVAGGLDRIFIRKAEAIDDLCTSLVLVTPEQGGNPLLTITTPAMWAVESASIAQGSAGCLELGPLKDPVVDAAAGAGAVTWLDAGLCPATLDLDVTLDFIAGDLPWVPLKDQLTATDLAVEMCV